MKEGDGQRLDAFRHQIAGRLLHLIEIERNVHAAINQSVAPVSRAHDAAAPAVPVCRYRAG